MAQDPILDLAVFTDRNFAIGRHASSPLIGFGMFSSMLLVAVFTQKLLGYDAWTVGPRAGARRPRQHALAHSPAGS